MSGAATIPTGTALVAGDPIAIDDYIDFTEIAAPAAPAANTVRFYVIDESGQSNLAFQRSDGSTGKIRPATQVEVEAASANDVFMSPGRQHFHPGHPKATGRGGSGGGVEGTAYNVSGIVRNSAGKFTVTLSVTMSGVYWVVATVIATTGGVRFATVVDASATTFGIEIYNDDGTPNDTDFAFAVYGDLA